MSVGIASVRDFEELNILSICSNKSCLTKWIVGDGVSDLMYHAGHFVYGWESQHWTGGDGGSTFSSLLLSYFLLLQTAGSAGCGEWVRVSKLHSTMTRMCFWVKAYVVM